MRQRLLLCFLLASPSLSQAAPLTFNAALGLAERQSPALSAQKARVDAAQSSAVSADALPDPKLFLGVDNLPATGTDRWKPNSDFMTMKKIGVMQEVPNADKRHARTDAARAEVEISQAEQRAERIKLHSDAAQAWLRCYYLQKRITVLEDVATENSLLAQAVHARLASSRGDASDTVMPKQEAAQLADTRDELERDLAKARAELRRLIGPQGNEPLAGDPPPFVIDANAFRQQVHLHPELATFGPANQKAAAEVREAEAAKKPDWGVEVAYQQRAPRFGDMVSVQLSFDLPIFTGSRQEPRIAARRMEAIRIAAEQEATLRMHAAELDNDLADHAALTRQLQRARETWLPLAQQKVELQSAAYQSGKLDLVNLLVARRELIVQRLKIIDLEQQRELVAGKLYFSFGEGAQ